jgi:hypothetical protein
MAPIRVALGQSGYNDLKNDFKTLICGYLESDPTLHLEAWQHHLACWVPDATRLEMPEDQMGSARSGEERRVSDGRRDPPLAT